LAAHVLITVGAVVALYLFALGPGIQPDGSILRQVPLGLAVPVLLAGYSIGVLRNMAEDSRAMRREMQASRHELEAIRLELTRQRVEERLR
jgi:NADH:ubiquinone oxidoreductase subunit 6 (subunit J)